MAWTASGVGELTGDWSAETLAGGETVNGTRGGVGCRVALGSGVEGYSAGFPEIGRNGS